MHPPKQLRDSRVMKYGSRCQFFRAALLITVACGMQACVRNHPNEFVSAPPVQPQCSIETLHSSSGTRTFQGAATRFKRGAKLTYAWSFSDDAAAKTAGREFTITFQSAVPRRAARIHLVVNASDGTQAACDTVIW